MTRDVALFDLDGTLSESEPGIVGSLVMALGTVGVAVPAPEVLRLAIGPPFDTGLVDIGVPTEHVPAVIAAYRDVYEVSGLFETRLYDGVPEMLDALRASGVILAVATSKPQDTADRVLDHLGLAPYFTFVAGATYDGTRRTKADVIGHALERLDVAGGPAVVMIGDRHHDIEGAAAYGIDTIATVLTTRPIAGPTPRAMPSAGSTNGNTTYISTQRTAATMIDVWKALRAPATVPGGASRGSRSSRRIHRSAGVRCTGAAGRRRRTSGWAPMLIGTGERSVGCERRGASRGAATNGLRGRGTP